MDRSVGLLGQTLIIEMRAQHPCTAQIPREIECKKKSRLFIQLDDLGESSCAQKLVRRCVASLPCRLERCSTPSLPIPNDAVGPQGISTGQSVLSERPNSQRIMRPPMAFLRSRTLLVRLMLAWFICALGVAGASPMVKPKTMDIVCSSTGGVHLVVVGDDDQADTAGQHTLDCSLCLNATTPPVAQFSSSIAPQPLAHALLPLVAAHIASLVGAPLPPRGPPSLS